LLIKALGVMYMKKILLFSMIVLSLFLFACQPAPAPQPKIMCPDGNIVDDASMCAKPEPIMTCDDGILNQDETNIDCGGACAGYWYDNACHTEPKPVPPAGQPTETETKPTELSPDLAALLANADNYNNFQYSYKGPEASTQIYKVYVWKNLIKIQLPASATNDFGAAFDTVYLNTADKTAKGYCLWDSKNRCSSKGSVPVNFEKYNFKTAYQWTKEITAGSIAGNELVFRRSSQRVPFVYQEKSSVMWVDAYYGLVAKVVVGLDSNGLETEKTVSYVYEDLKVSSVFEKDVTPP
jgi:hypothetical protein